MAIEKVKAFFREYGMEENILEFDESSATVELAAQVIGCIPARIGKTIALSVEDRCILILTAGDTKIDNAKFKSRFGVKPKMLTPDKVLECTGHAVGGVCPFGIPAGTEVYLDSSLQRFETVFPACGSHNSAIELSIAQIEEFTDYIEWVNVCKQKQETVI